MFIFIDASPLKFLTRIWVHFILPVDTHKLVRPLKISVKLKFMH